MHGEYGSKLSFIINALRYDYILARFRSTFAGLPLCISLVMCQNKTVERATRLGSLLSDPLDFS